MFCCIVLLLIGLFANNCMPTVGSRDVAAQPNRKATQLNFESGLSPTGQPLQQQQQQQQQLQQRPLHLLVAAMEIAPFMMRRQKLQLVEAKPDSDNKSNNNNNKSQLASSNSSDQQLEWFGYCMDFMEKLVEHLPYNVTYEIYQVADNHYGTKHDTSQQQVDSANQRNSRGSEDKQQQQQQTGPKIWSGIVGELQQGNAHLALAPLSVMAERELVIDFTVPFYDLVGSQILIKRPDVPDDYFKFLTVLDGQVWLSIGLAYLVTSVVIFLFDRLSPYSRKNTARLKRLKALDGGGHSPIGSSGYSGHQMNNNNLKDFKQASSWRSSFGGARRRSSLLMSIFAANSKADEPAVAISTISSRQTTSTSTTATSGQRRGDLFANWTQPDDRKYSMPGFGYDLNNQSATGANVAPATASDFDHDKTWPDFGLRDSLWFCITSLTPQGGGEAPANLSGRLVAGAWWLFCFIIIASYTANLAAFLTVSRLDIPIDSMDDLIKQYRIKYAPLENTAEHAYFERMAYIEEIFYNIWKDMSLNETLSEEERAKFAVWDYPISDKYTKVWAQIRQAGMPKTYDEAMARVRASNLEDGFALLTDAMVIKHAAMTDCSLKSVGDEFSRKPIALGVQKNLGRLRDDISHAILQLINQRFMETLREKWWTNNPDRVVCENSDESEGISIKNIGGVFIIIIAGVLLSFLVWSIERLAYKTKIEISQSLLVENANAG